MFYIIILINLAITIYNLQLLKLFSATIYHILLDTPFIFVSALHLLFNDSFFYSDKLHLNFATILSSFKYSS